MLKVKKYLIILLAIPFMFSCSGPRKVVDFATISTLVEIHKKGRERYCEIQPNNLIPAFLWLEQYQKLWEDKLDSFENYVIKLKNKKSKDE